MEITPYTPQELYSWVLDEPSGFLLVDVRNSVEFGRFKVEGPYPIDMINVPYMDFIEHEDESVKKVPTEKPIRIVCAKEGSAKYVAEILHNNNYEDVRYLEGGIKSWGNMLSPVLVADGDYQLYQFIRPGKASCSYGLIYQNEMMLFDPSRNVKFYLDFAKEKGVSIVKTCETHLQADYIAGSNQISLDTGAAFMAPPDDFVDSVHKFIPARDGDIYTFSNGGPEVKVIHTPGHTPGSTCYYIDNTYLLSGDTVFIQSVGRPDLGGKAVEWAKQLFATLKTTIGALPGDTVILPAHFLVWDEADKSFTFAATLDDIYQRNKDIYDIDTEETFIKFIQDNMRVQPPEYATIRLVNAGTVSKSDEEQETLDLGKNECAASAGR